MSFLENLRCVKKQEYFARLLGFDHESLIDVLYKKNPATNYTSFSIPKKSGNGRRTIKAPQKRLKFIQSKLSLYLYNCLEEIESEENFPILSYAFQKKRAIKDNALRHKNRRWILNIDLEDFFLSFNFGRVRGFFIKDNRFKLEPKIATTIAQIACDGTALPQGSPCSPIISELIARILDIRLLKFAKKNRLIYTRYADDITFSTNELNFPANVASIDVNNNGACALSTELTDIIIKSGFKINDKKTRIQHRSKRQIVTGLVVNKKVNIIDEYYRKTRAMCHRVFEKGNYYINSDNPTVSTDNLHPLNGILNFIYHVKYHERSQKKIENAPKVDTAFIKLFKKFLFYKIFIALEKPLIVGEGVTDSIYLRCAIKYSKTLYPNLCEFKNLKLKKLLLSFFSREQLAAKLLSIADGGSNNFITIGKFYSDYLHKSHIREIKHTPFKAPVILLLDNDDGLKDVSSYFYKRFRVKFDLQTSSDFYFITDNLYIVKTPECLPGGVSGSTQNTCIEDLFDKSILNIPIAGKNFNKSNNIDPSHEYGKRIFASNVVFPRRESIDYSGFEPLLDRISSAIVDYKKRII